MPIAHRSDLRNVAIVAHVDHGKTTLVDAMLRQTNSFGCARAHGGARHGLERPRAREGHHDPRQEHGDLVRGHPRHRRPGHHQRDRHPRPRRLRRRGRARARRWSTASCCSSTRARARCRRPASCCARRSRAKLPVILLVNKTDRPDARIDEVVEESHDLLLGLASDLHDDVPDLDLDSLLDVPVVYASGRNGAASWNKPENGELPDNDDLEPLFDAILKHVPAPPTTTRRPCRRGSRTSTPRRSSAASPCCASSPGRSRRVRRWPGCATTARDSNVRITELLKTRALDRYPAEEAHAGDIVAVAGIDEITIGETIADPDDIRPLPAITVDEPAISMTIGTNTSPIVGKVKGHKLTARMVKDRLDRELIGNVSIRVVDIGRPDAWEVQGRGELALAILVENMRREGFELTVGKPQVVTRKVDGKTHEPFEHLTIDAPEEYLGAITQLLAARKGRMESMSNHGTGWVRMEFIVPSRGLIGFRTEFLTITRGTGIANAISHGYDEWAGTITTRTNGSIVADRAGVVTPFAMVALQERMSFFVEPTQEVYEGMVIGENSRADDMDVNITKEKQLTNIRSSTSDNFEKLTPTRKLTLEEALEFAREDECVEVTPEVVRIRKVVLDQTERARATSRLKKQDASV